MPLSESRLSRSLISISALETLTTAAPSGMSQVISSSPPSASRLKSSSTAAWAVFAASVTVANSPVSDTPSANGSPSFCNAT